MNKLWVILLVFIFLLFILPLFTKPIDEIDIVIILGCFLLSPVVVFIEGRYKTKIPKPIDIRECELTSFGSKPQLFFSRTREALEREGFSLYGYFVYRLQGSFAFFVVYRSRDLRDTVVPTFIQHTMIRESYTEFYTEFESEKELHTLNLSRHIRPFSKNPDVRDFVFPNASVARLYSLHKALIGRYYSQEKPILNSPEENILEEQKRSITEFYERQIPAGYLYSDDRSNAYRYTWKEAILIPCKSVWAILPIYKAYLRIRARNIVKNLEGYHYQNAV